MQPPLDKIFNHLTHYQHLSDCYNLGVQATRLIERSLRRCGVQDPWDLESGENDKLFLPEADLDSARQVVAMLQSVAGDDLPPIVSRMAVSLSTARELCELFGELECWSDTVRVAGQELKDEHFPGI